MCRRYASLLVTLHRLQNFKTHVCSGTSKVLSTVDEPLECADKQDDAESYDAVICQSQFVPFEIRGLLTHVRRCHRKFRWEQEQDSRDDCV